MSAPRIAAALLLAVTIAAAQETRPTTRPTSRPIARGTPWLDLPVGLVIHYEGTVQRTYETPQGRGGVSTVLDASCVVLGKEKSGQLRLGWTVREHMVKPEERDFISRVIVYLYDPVAQSFVEAPDDELPPTADLGSPSDRPPFIRIFAEQIRSSSQWTEEREVATASGFPMPLSIPQTVDVTVLDSEVTKRVLVHVAPKGDRPVKAKLHLPHVADNVETSVAGFEPAIVSAAEDYTLDAANGRVVAVSGESNVEINDQFASETKWSMKEMKRETVTPEVLADMDGAVTELHVATRQQTLRLVEIEQTLKDFEEHHPKAGMREVVEMMRRAVKFYPDRVRDAGKGAEDGAKHQ